MVASVLACATVAGIPPAPVKNFRLRMDIDQGAAAVSVLDTETLETITRLDFPSINPTQNVDYSNVNRTFLRGIQNDNTGTKQALQTGLDNQSWSAFFQGENMNQLNVFGNPSHAMMANIPSWEYNIGPGTVFVPDNPAYQNMVTYARLQYSFSLNESLVTGINGSFFAQEGAGARTLCANMAKKAPDNTVKYYPYGNSDKVIVKLAELSEQSRSNGPWDQARLWIYTDKASLEEINNRLNPNVVPGYYTRALREIDEAGGFTDKDRTNKKLFSPELLYAPTGSKPASKYFFEAMAKNFPKETKAAFEKGHDNAVAALWQENGAELKNDHLNFMFEFLAPSKNTDVQVGLLTFLQRRVPSTQRARIKALPMFSKVTDLANSEDKKVADLAASVLKGY